MTTDLGGQVVYRVRHIDYFSTIVRDRPGAAYELLDMLAGIGINLLAFTAVPMGPVTTQLTIFPEDSAKLESEARLNRLSLDGPHPALMVQGDDELGVLADIHRTLSRANVNVYAATGVSTGHGSFGYIVYVRPEQFTAAAAALAL